MLSTSEREHLTELGLLRAIPLFAMQSGIKKGRLKAIFTRLAENIDHLISNNRSIYNYPRSIDIALINERILNFAKKVKWEGQAVDIITLLSFVLGLIEESRFKYPARIVDELNNAFEYLTQTEDEETETYIKDAETALEFWREITKAKETKAD